MNIWRMLQLGATAVLSEADRILDADWRRYQHGKTVSPMDPTNRISGEDGSPASGSENNKRKKPPKTKVRRAVKTTPTGPAGQVPTADVEKLNDLHAAVDRGNYDVFYELIDGEHRVSRHWLSVIANAPGPDGMTLVERVLLYAPSHRFLKLLMKRVTDKGRERGPLLHSSDRFEVDVAGHAAKVSVIELITLRDEDDYGPVESMLEDVIKAAGGAIRPSDVAAAMRHAIERRAIGVFKMLADSLGPKLEDAVDDHIIDGLRTAAIESGSREMYNTVMRRLSSAKHAGVPNMTEARLARLIETHPDEDFVAKMISDAGSKIVVDPDPDLKPSSHSILFAAARRGDRRILDAVLRYGGRKDFWAVRALQYAQTMASDDASTLAVLHNALADEERHRILDLRAKSYDETELVGIIEHMMVTDADRHVAVHGKRYGTPEQAKIGARERAERRLVQIIKDHPWHVSILRTASSENLPRGADADSRNVKPQLGPALKLAVQYRSLPVLAALCDIASRGKRDITHELIANVARALSHWPNGATVARDRLEQAMKERKPPKETERNLPPPTKRRIDDEIKQLNPGYADTLAQLRDVVLHPERHAADSKAAAQAVGVAIDHVRDAMRELRREISADEKALQDYVRTNAPLLPMQRTASSFHGRGFDPTPTTVRNAEIRINAKRNMLLKLAAGIAKKELKSLMAEVEKARHDIAQAMSHDAKADESQKLPKEQRREMRRRASALDGTLLALRQLGA